MDNFEKFVWIYFIIGILTFGFAANAEYAENETYVFNNVERKYTGFDRTFTALLPSMVWPLYLSYKAFYFARPKNTEQKQ